MERFTIDGELAESVIPRILDDLLPAEVLRSPLGDSVGPVFRWQTRFDDDDLVLGVVGGDECEGDGVNAALIILGTHDRRERGVVDEPV